MQNLDTATVTSWQLFLGPMALPIAMYMAAVLGPHGPPHCNVHGSNLLALYLSHNLRVESTFFNASYHCTFTNIGNGDAVGLSAQARDTAQQEEEQERANSNLRRVTVQRRKKELHSSTKKVLMRLRNDS